MKDFPSRTVLACSSIYPLGAVSVLITAAAFAQEKPAPVAAQDTVLQEMVVTANAENKGYAGTGTTTATRLPEEVLESARSVRVIPRDLIEDRAVLDPQEAVQNVSGVQRGGSFTGTGETYVLRGFRQQTFIKDGFRAGSIPGSTTFSAVSPTDVANLESIEILKGPSSIYFGRGEPGGVVNYVTRQPSFENSHDITQSIGSYDFYRTEVNANQVLAEGKVAARLDAAYETGNSFFDYVESERLFVAPSVLWKIDQDTTLSFKAEYSHDDRSTIPGVPYLNGAVVAGVPYHRYYGEEDFTNNDTEMWRGLLTLEHRWNDNNKSTLSFHGLTSQSDGGYFILYNFAGPLQDPVTGDIARAAAATDFSEEYFTTRLDHVISWDITSGSASLPAVRNELLISGELDSQTNDNIRFLSGHTPLNPYDPVYTGYQPQPLVPFPGFPTRFSEDTQTDAKAWSALLSDKVSFGESVFLSFGARFEWFDATNQITYADPSVPFSDVNADLEQGSVNPFAGIVVKPLSNVSIYGSYSESTYSFKNISLGTTNGDSLDPERARQFEVGTKAEFLDKRLIASAALFQINKTDVAAADPNNPLFSINAGEERSRGFELDLAGELTPGWKVMTSYAYVDSCILDDPSGALTGNKRPGVPENSGSVFTTYEIQGGVMEGLGFGGGIYVSDKVAVDTANTGTLPGYAQADALIFYHRDNWRVQLNVKNVFDKEFYYSEDSGTMVQAANPRTWVATFKYHF